MSDSQTLYEKIGTAMIADHDGVKPGKMMSSPAITYKEKVFAFYNSKTEAMGFKVGDNFDPAAKGIQHHAPLAPFKTKPPLRGWLQVMEADSDKWETLAQHALDVLKASMDG